MNKDTREFAIDMAKRFYNVEFDQFGDKSLGNVMDELHDDYDHKLRIDILNSANSIIFSEDTVNEIRKNIPDISDDAIEEVQAFVLHHVTLAAASILINRIVAVASFAMYGSFVTLVNNEDKTKDEIISGAREIINQVVGHASAEAAELAMEQARDALEDFEKRAGKTTH